MGQKDLLCLFLNMKGLNTVPRLEILGASGSKNVQINNCIQSIWHDPKGMIRTKIRKS